MDDETLDIVGMILKRYREIYPDREIMHSIQIEIDGEFFQKIVFDDGFPSAKVEKP